MISPFPRKKKKRRYPRVKPLQLSPQSTSNQPYSKSTPSTEKSYRMFQYNILKDSLDQHGLNPTAVKVERQVPWLMMGLLMSNVLRLAGKYPRIGEMNTEWVAVQESSIEWLSWFLGVEELMV